MKKILYFSAAWCGPCKTLGPTINNLQSEGLPIQKIDVDSDQTMAAKYSVRSIPCLILIDGGGNEVKRLVGNQPGSTIKNWFNN
tara:strand:+ start:667 stop:918 length:252 start_codon:yes stop_codon:yes gene_type:complete